MRKQNKGKLVFLIPNKISNICTMYCIRGKKITRVRAAIIRKIHWKLSKPHTQSQVGPNGFYVMFGAGTVINHLLVQLFSNRNSIIFFPALIICSFYDIFFFLPSTTCWQYQLIRRTNILPSSFPLGNQNLYVHKMFESPGFSKETLEN